MAAIKRVEAATLGGVITPPSLVGDFGGLRAVDVRGLCEPADLDPGQDARSILVAETPGGAGTIGESRRWLQRNGGFPEMQQENEFIDKFWRSIRSDMTAMVGTGSVSPRPMTAQFDGDHPVIYFFTSKETDLAKAAASPQKAQLIYAAKGHDLFATVDGALEVRNDPALIDRLWNRFVAAWFEGGKDDPKLCLLRFDPGSAEVWKDASSLVAGVKMFLGMGDPKEDYKDDVAKVKLGRN